MSSEPMLFEPEVEEILREVAADPRSSLLKITRPAHLRGHFERYSNVGPKTAGLTVVERHLLLVHRSEVALLIGDVCRRRFAVGDATLNRSLTVDDEVQIYSQHELRERAEEIRRNPVDDDPSIEQVLARCVSGEIEREPTITELATAMARLEPSDSALALAGLDLTLRGSARVALHLYRSFLDRRVAPRLETVVWDNVAHAYSILGDEPRALDASRRAARLSEGSPVSHFAWLQLALVVGAEQEAAAAAEALNRILGPDHMSVERYTAVLHDRKASREFMPTEPGRAIARKIMDRLGGAAGRIVDVWL